MRRLYVLTLLVAVGCSGSDTDARPTTETRPATETSGIAAPAPAPPVPGQDVVRRYTDMLYRGETDLLFEKFSPEMQQSLPLDKLSILYEQMITHYGRETGIVGEEAQANDEYRGFVRWSRFDKTDEIIEIQWILREDDAIAGLFVRPAKRRVESQGTLDAPR